MAKEVPVNDEQLPFGTKKEASSGPEPVVMSIGAPLSQIEQKQRPVKSKSSRKSVRREFFLPVSGFVWLFPEEVAVVDHPAFQRLGRIYQLGQAHLVFRGATHKRFEHVLGTLNVVQRMIAAVETNSEKLEEFPQWAPPLSEIEERFVRLGALLHDIGHLAAGHTIEDELQLVSKHDQDRRLDIVLNGEWRNQNGQNLAELINEKYREFVPEELATKGIVASDIVRMLIRKVPRENDAYEKTQGILEKSTSVRLAICHDMIGNTICADLLDYIHRDWYHVGKPRPFDDRLLQYMEIRRGNEYDVSGPQPSDKFVISLGKRPKIRTDAVSHILDLLEWRYSLSETVLFHRTKLAAAAMLDRALFELWGGIDNEDEIVSFFLPLSDEEMVTECRKRAQTVRDDSKTAKEKKEAAAAASRVLEGLERRQLFASLSTRFAGDLPGDVVVGLKEKYADDPKRPKAAARNRNAVLRGLEQDFKLPRGSLAMYCPAGMNRKIAEVQIAVGNEIEQFSRYEQKHDNQLTGGHLDAQLRRFDRLWRVHFFIERTAREQLGERLYLLQQAIDKLALGNLVDDEDGVSVARSIAKLIVQTEGSPWKGYSVSDTALSAKSQSATAPEQYPFGAPGIRAFLYK